MIEYVEIRDKVTRQVIGIVDTAKSIIWKSVYYGVGEFEIYAPASAMVLDLLIVDNYVTRPDLEGEQNDCGIIERIEITDDPQDGKMIVASGRLVKSILDRRIVYYPILSGVGSKYIWNCTASVLQGNVEAAVRGLIEANAVNAYKTIQDTNGAPKVEADTVRNIPEIDWKDEDVTGLAEKIVIDTTAETTQDAEKQVTYKVLLDYTDSVLQEYGLGAKMWLDRDSKKFRYKVFKGVDRSRDNTEGNTPIIFSEEFDNLLSVSYAMEKTAYKTTALIGGDGEGVERKCAFANAWVSGLERRETFVDMSSISSTYKDETDQEQVFENDIYRQQLEAQGRQSISALQIEETFDGGIDLTNSPLVFRQDYNVGDIITVEDKSIGKYSNPRILTVTEVQDDDGYKIDVEYGA